MTVKMVQKNGDGGPGRPTTRVVVNGKELTMTAWRIYELLVENPDLEAQAIGRRLRLTKSRVYQCLRELKATGLVERRGAFKPVKLAA